MRASSITVEWEDGVRVQPPLTVGSKADAFAHVDSIMRSHEYPSSVVVIIRESGFTTWAQHGSNVTVNRTIEEAYAFAYGQETATEAINYNVDTAPDVIPLMEAGTSEFWDEHIVSDVWEFASGERWPATLTEGPLMQRIDAVTAAFEAGYRATVTAARAAGMGAEVGL